MKFLDWISRKPKKDQALPDPLVSRHQNQQQVLKKSVHAVQSKLLKLNQMQGSKQLDQQDPAAKRREIVKIFVNHEEYGLLAIGTLGLYDASGVEPEIELFEVKPNILFQPDHRSGDLQEKSNKFQPPPSLEDNRKNDHKPEHENEEDEKRRGRALVLGKTGKKKVFSVDPSSLIGSKLFKRSSKLLDRLLHPLNHLSLTKIITPRDGHHRDHHDDDDDQQLAVDDSKKKKTSSKSLSLFQKLVLSGTSSKQITGSGTRNSSSIESRARSQHNHDHDHDHRSSTTSTSSSSSSCSSGGGGNPRRAATRSRGFACMSLQVEDDEDESDNESEMETDMRGRSNDLAREEKVALSPSSSTGCPACSAPGDPNPGHQQTCAKDIQPEYWIRTDSDYVVLEL